MTHIEQRTGTAAAWTAANPVLNYGEIGWESDTRKGKLGDGVTAWSALPYLSGVSTVAGRSGAVTLAVADVAGAAPLASPVLTGDPKAPTPATGDNDTSIATTAFVKAQAYAPLASPAFTGNPTAPTPAPGDNDTSVATTAFVKAADDVVVAALAAKAPLADPTFTGDPKAPTPAVTDNDTSIATTAHVKAVLGATYAAMWRDVVNSMSFVNPLTWTVMNNATERTAMTVAYTKQRAASALLIHVSGSFGQSSGGAVILDVGVRVTVGGVVTDYLIAQNVFAQTPAYLTTAGRRVLTGLGSGAYTVEPIIRTNANSTVEVANNYSTLSLVVEER